MCFTEKLFEISNQEVTKILNHSIVLSLANVDPMPRSKRKLLKNDLLIVRNNFYIQDYYYLIYGYEVIRNIVIERNPFLDINQQLKFSEIRDPLLSTSIDTIRKNIENFGLSLIDNPINKSTKNYILFKIKSACESISKALAIQFACIYVYQQIGEILKRSNTDYLGDIELSEWLKLLVSFSDIEYFESFCNILDYHQRFIGLSIAEIQ